MKCQKFFLVFLIGSFMFLSLFSATPASAILGDVNGDEDVTIGDAISLIAYLKGEGPPPVVRNDADCDNCPGISIGDALQIIGYTTGGEDLFVTSQGPSCRCKETCPRRDTRDIRPRTGCAHR